MDKISRSNDYARKALRYNTGLQLMARAYLGKWDSIDLNERHVEHIGPEMPLGSIPSWSGIVEASAALRMPYSPYRAHYRIWRDDYDAYMDQVPPPEMLQIDSYISGWLQHSADLGYPLPMYDLDGGYYLLSDHVPWALPIASYAMRKAIDACMQIRRLDPKRRYA